MAIEALICAECKKSGRLIAGNYKYDSNEELIKDIENLENFTLLEINGIPCNPTTAAITALVTNTG